MTDRFAQQLLQRLDDIEDRLKVVEESPNLDEIDFRLKVVEDTQKPLNSQWESMIGKPCHAKFYSVYKKGYAITGVDGHFLGTHLQGGNLKGVALLSDGRITIRPIEDIVFKPKQT